MLRRAAPTPLYSGTPKRTVYDLEPRGVKVGAPAPNVAQPRAGKGVRGLITDAREWATGRIWIWRVLILAYIAYAGFCHLIDPNAYDVTSWLTVCVHELGHVVMRWAPFGVYVAAGSVAQVLAPTYLLFHFFRQRDYFAVTVAGSWLSFSFFGLARYIGDSEAMALSYVTVGPGEPVHDWNYLLSAWGILPMDTEIAQCVWLAAAIVLIASFAWGAWLCCVMIRSRRAARSLKGKL